MTDQQVYEMRLRDLLTGNAVFSLVSGSVLLIAAPWFARQFGAFDPLWMRIAGGLIVLFGIDVYYASRRWLNALTGFVVSAADASWVLATLILLPIFWSAIEPTGRALALVIGVIVAIFGTLQFHASVGIRHAIRQRSQPACRTAGAGH